MYVYVTSNTWKNSKCKETTAHIQEMETKENSIKCREYQRSWKLTKYIECNNFKWVSKMGWKIQSNSFYKKYTQNKVTG